MIITLTLNPSIDYILQVKDLQTEDTLRAAQADYEAGGKGINVSRVLTRLGVENQAWGYAGGCTGGWLKDFMDCEQVSHDFIDTGHETRINPIITEMTTQKQLRVSAPGQTISPEHRDALVQKVRDLSADTKWLALGGSMPPGLQPELYRELIELAREKGICCLLDADGANLKEGVKACPMLIKPNQYELERLVGKALNTMDVLVEAAQDLIRRGCVEIIVTSMADQGAAMITREQVLVAHAPKVEVKSKVGAGDSMVAGLIYGFYKGLPLEDILKHGIAAGTAAVMTPGTELAYVSDMDQLYPNIRVEALTRT